MSKYLIEINDDDVDDRADELVRRMVDEGSVTMFSPGVDVQVTVVGRATHAGFVKLPGSAETYVVEPLA